MSLSPEIISAIHHSGHQFVIAITGGGSQAIGDLLSVPGGSQSLLEAVVPYSWPALVEFLGGKPDQACSERTARAMAMAAWERARRWAAPDFPVDSLWGFGCTASLASDRPKRGEHRLHIAVQNAAFTDVFSLTLEKGRRTRAEEERLAADLLIRWIGIIGGTENPWDMPGVPEMGYGGTSAKRLEWCKPFTRELMLGERQQVLVKRVTQPHRFEDCDEPTEPRLIFPGAFNPLHDAHRRMAQIASTRASAPAIFEISIENVDKPLLDHQEIADRVCGFEPGALIALTRAPTFVRKSGIFPGATFIVGADTIVRIADPKYYGNDVAKRDEALATIAQRGCRFLVFGRNSQHEFKTLAQLSLPPALLAICDQVPESEFRWDLSSTELRRQQEGQQQ